MATTTTNYGIRIPQSSDYVAMGYDSMDKLGQDVDDLLAGGQFMGGFRNKLINGNFDFWQRGASFTAAAGYTADRWRIDSSGSTHTTTRQTPGLDAILANTLRYNLRCVTSAGAGIGDYVALSQRIENVGTLAGKKVTVSFWAWASSGTPKIGVSLDRYYGTGGSPSATDNGAGTYVTISTAKARYTVSFTLGNLSGKTQGTDLNDYLGVNLWLDAGSNLNTRSGGIGHQSATFNIAGVQIEAGAYVTDFEHRPLAVERALCLRYFETTFNGVAPALNVTPYRFYLVMGASSNNSGVSQLHTFSVPKRSSPTMTAYSTTAGGNFFQSSADYNTWANLGTAAFTDITPDGFHAQGVAAGGFPSGGLRALRGNWIADSEL